MTVFADRMLSFRPVDCNDSDEAVDIEQTPLMERSTWALRSVGNGAHARFPFQESFENLPRMNWETMSRKRELQFSGEV